MFLTRTTYCAVCLPDMNLPLNLPGMSLLCSPFPALQLRLVLNRLALTPRVSYDHLLLISNALDEILRVDKTLLAQSCAC
jgi:hypothetical protein